MDEKYFPLCFGAVTAYAEDSERCKACDAYMQCGTQVLATIAKLKAEYNVEAIVRVHKAIKAKSAKPARVRDLDSSRPQFVEAPKVTVQVESPSVLQTQNVMMETRSAITRIGKVTTPAKIRQSLSEGSNPFSKKMPEPWLISQLMLMNSATAQNITAAFDKAGLSTLKASAYRVAFVSMKVAQVVGDRLKPRSGE